VKILTYGGICNLSLCLTRWQKWETWVGPRQYRGLPQSQPFLAVRGSLWQTRIARGKFTLSGKEYPLAQKNGPNASTAAKGIRQVVCRPKIWPRPKARPRIALCEQGWRRGYRNLDITDLHFTDDNALRPTTLPPPDKEQCRESYAAFLFQSRWKGRRFELRSDDVRQTTPSGSTLIRWGIRAFPGTPFDFSKRPESAPALTMMTSN